jgi:hypothetical protein
MKLSPAYMEVLLKNIFLIIFLFAITLSIGIFTNKSFKKKKKKWILISLSIIFSGLLIFTLFFTFVTASETYHNRYYNYSEIKFEGNKYYRNEKLITGVSSYINNKDSIVLIIKNGKLVRRTVYLFGNKEYESYTFFDDNGEFWFRGVIGTLKNGKSLNEGLLWNLIAKDSSRSLNDYVLIYGKPNKIEKENNRTFYSFLIEEESSECTDKRSFVGKVSFEKPFYFESGCAVNQKLITESKENILSKIKGKYFVARSNGSEIGTLEIKYDNTFIMSYKILGGSVSEGAWEIYDGDDVGQANIILYPPPAQVAAGNIAKEIYLVVNENDLSIRVRGSETIYELKK